MSIAKFTAWLAARRGNLEQAKRIRAQAEAILKWNADVEAGKISRKGHRNDGV